MKRTLALATTALVALVATSLAVGKGLDGNSKSAQAVAGAFTATTASRVETRTCTTTEGKTLVTTSGIYTGTAAGDADLTGAATLRATSLINTTDNIGLVSGSLRIDVARAATRRRSSKPCTAAGRSPALLQAVHMILRHTLVANLSAGFSGTGGIHERQARRRNCRRRRRRDRPGPVPADAYRA